MMVLAARGEKAYLDERAFFFVHAVPRTTPLSPPSGLEQARNHVATRIRLSLEVEYFGTATSRGLSFISKTNNPFFIFLRRDS